MQFTELIVPQLGTKADREQCMDLLREIVLDSEILSGMGHAAAQLFLTSLSILCSEDAGWQLELSVILPLLQERLEEGARKLAAEQAERVEREILQVGGGLFMNECISVYTWNYMITTIYGVE